ncbi:MULTISPECIES: sugar ABC transporter substrate-binding protein [unclassified Streptomyces]|uniref:sugar ABC transporter substrate-binding protein n=1 Tax=unclassified Streptomyces TaxID=2593676 RepID=UPI000381B057|nr:MULTISPECIES: sugar ABC transporter substrate-binding protein [unclassified Streptomyces]MYQ78972.1 extracellular solute-binding protein [Streptomyces sp. SID4923]
MARPAKTVAGISVAVAAALSLTACGGGSGAQQSADAKQTLTVWGMGEEAKRLATVAKDFEKDNPNITVKVTPIGWDVVGQKMTAAAAAGKLPDMAQMGSTMMGQYIALDVLEPVNTKTFKKSDFFPATWNSNVVDGTAYGVPWYADVRGLYYRTDLAEKAGVDKAPVTWDDHHKLAEAYQKNGAQYGTALQPGNTGAWQSWLQFLYSEGGSLTDADGKAALDSPEAVKAFRTWGSYFKDGLAKKNFVPGADVAKTFAKGEEPTFMSGPWMVQNLNEQQPQLKGKWKTAPLPAGPKGSVSWVGGASLVTFKDSEHKAAAEKFTQYLTTPETQAAWYGATKSLPANKAAYDLPEIKDSAEADSLKVFRQALDTGKEIPALEKWNEIAAAIEGTLEKIAQGGDPAAEAKKLQATTEGLISQ